MAYDYMPRATVQHLVDNVKDELSVKVEAELATDMKAEDPRFKTEYMPGDTIDIGMCCFSGLISNDTKDLWFSIPLNKRVSSRVTDISIVTKYFCARGPLGYVSEFQYVARDNWLPQDVYITKLDMNDICINIRLRKDGRFGNVNNNTPVSVIAQDSTATLTFV